MTVPLRKVVVMKRHAHAAIALCAVAALTLSGCGLSTDSGSEPEPTGGGASTQQSAGDPVDQIAAVTDDELQGTTIKLARFFGDCADTTDGVTDVGEATTECEAIQILTNKFVADNQWGIDVERLGGASWYAYYDGLNAALASSDRPDIAVMHASHLPEYASKDLLVPVPEGLDIDLDDATDPARAAVDFDGVAYAVPFDTHAVISHLNMDLLAEAGLTDEDGSYTMPTTVDDFLTDAETFKEATGKTFLDVAMTGDPMGSRLWTSLVWQQDADFIDTEARTATADSEAAVTALEFINTLADKGYTDTTHDYDASQQSFLRGNSAIMFNGVWAVNQYTLEAPFDYQVTDAPMLFDSPASWADGHTWAVPVQADADPVKYRAAFEFARFLYEHTADWAIATGHMASRQSALDSDAYQQAPHRQQYLKTASEYGHMQPRLVEWPAIADLVQEKIESTWLNDVPVEQALGDLQAQITAKLE